MLKNSARLSDKNAIFICQITESSLRVAKCHSYRFAQRKFLDFEILNFAQGVDDKVIAEKISEVFKKLKFNNNPVVASLPRSSVTARYLKVPSQAPEEIENIILLQAPRFLPYPAAELITGYEHIQTDKEGFSHINIIIVHKDIVERYTNLFSALKIKDFNLTLSSYGLSNLYEFFQPQEQGPVMLVDIEHPLVELVIAAKGRLIFSRAFKISEMDWQANLATELNKTKDAYLKELPFKEPVKIVIPNHPRVSQKIEEALTSLTNFPVTRLIYQDKIPAIPIFNKKIAKAENSLAVLVGLGLKKIPETLNLLPKDKKERLKKQIKVKENTKFAILILGLILVFTLGLGQNLNNKELYLKKLKNELSRFEKDAAGLVELESRYQLLEKRREKLSSSLELISQLHNVIPQEILLNNFSYDEEQQLILRGQAPESRVVFEFVKKLEKAQALKIYNIKIRYVTQKKIQAGVVTDFEIICTKEK
jgi:Tfp pilus assembly PilM family ATPase